MASEVQALVLEFYDTLLVNDLFEELLGRSLGLETGINSRSVLNYIPKDDTKTKRRLKSDVIALQQSYNAGEMSRISWIPGNDNSSNSLTKPTLCTSSPLWNVITSNHFLRTPQDELHHAKENCWIVKDSLTIRVTW